jgi:hypothetical protein
MEDTSYPVINENGRLSCLTNANDKQIEALLYSLDGLTEVEVLIQEGSNEQFIQADD